MEKEIENPPAFPVAIAGDEKAGWLPEHVEGMTLRDYFAGQVMLGMISAKSKSSYGWFLKDEPKKGAELSYEMADAMLKERLK